jgi:hypothetical protein
MEIIGFYRREINFDHWGFLSCFQCHYSVLSQRRMCPKHSSCASSAKLISQPERKPDKDMKDYDNSPTVRTPSALLDLFFASAQLLCHLRYTIHLRTMKISLWSVKFQGDKSGRNHLHLP